MEITYKELLKLTRISGQLEGIADALPRGILEFRTDVQKLKNLSKEIDDFVQSKIETAKKEEDHNE